MNDADSEWVDTDIPIISRDVLVEWLHWDPGTQHSHILRWQQWPVNPKWKVVGLEMEVNKRWSPYEPEDFFIVRLFSGSSDQYELHNKQIIARLGNSMGSTVGRVCCTNGFPYMLLENPRSPFIELNSEVVIHGVVIAQDRRTVPGPVR